jgi:YebC/PmpR family DNA-binding regulatory protein
MSGHSKWSQIKRGKAVTDGARSRVFSRFAKHIALESKKANGNAAAPSLAAVIARAKAANMPKDNIERAVAKGMSKDAGSLEQVVYEAYGPAGVALIVEAMTDNKNRTTQEIKHLLSQHGVELAAPGSALWAFSKKPEGGFAANEPLVDVDERDAESLEKLLDAIDEHEDVQVFFTNARGYESAGD